MKNPFVYRAGGVVSADIAVPDHEQEISFYASILTTGEKPFWRDDLMNNAGTPVIGLGKRIPEYEFLPLQWMPHFQVADVAASAARAVELGAKELMHSKTDDGQSQWAGYVDHDGAAFGIIPVVTEASDETQQDDGLGRISWLSLSVPDVSASGDFYEQVIGYSSQPAETKDNGEAAGPILMLMDNGNSAAEICPSCAGQDLSLIHI